MYVTCDNYKEHQFLLETAGYQQSKYIAYKFE